MTTSNCEGVRYRSRLVGSGRHTAPVTRPVCVYKRSWRRLQLVGVSAEVVSLGLEIKIQLYITCGTSERTGVVKTTVTDRCETTLPGILYTTIFLRGLFANLVRHCKSPNLLQVVCELFRNNVKKTFPS